MTLADRCQEIDVAKLQEVSLDVPDDPVCQ